MKSINAVPRWKNKSSWRFIWLNQIWFEMVYSLLINLRTIFYERLHLGKTKIKISIWTKQAVLFDFSAKRVCSWTKYVFMWFVICTVHTHKDMFPFRCWTCRQGFSDENLWKYHKNRCTTKRFECHLCKVFKRDKRDLVDHMRKHTGERLCCSKCPKQFQSGAGLSLHKKMHGKMFWFKCSNCNQGFTEKKLWKMHEGRCKVKQYEYHLFNKKCYQNKSHLEFHMHSKHTGANPFSSPKYPKRINRNSNLT